MPSLVPSWPSSNGSTRRCVRTIPIGHRTGSADPRSEVTAWRRASRERPGRQSQPRRPACHAGPLAPHPGPSRAVLGHVRSRARQLHEEGPARATLQSRQSGAPRPARQSLGIRPRPAARPARAGFQGRQRREDGAPRNNIHPVRYGQSVQRISQFGRSGRPWTHPPRRTRLRALWTEWSVEVRILGRTWENPA